MGPHKCEFCKYITNSKFNLGRHITRKHKDGSGNLVCEPISRTRSESLESFLENIQLINFAENFKKEGIDLKLILDMNKEDLRRMLTDLEINWGDRYKIEKEIEKHWSKAENNNLERFVENCDTVLEIEKTVEKSVSNVDTVLGIDTTDYEDTFEKSEELMQVADTDLVEANGVEKDCLLCSEAKKQKNPQHRCIRCGQVVCNLFCSIPDPDSDNEMHRVHKVGDTRCTSNEIVFHCPKCDEVCASNTTLQKHFEKHHEEFEITFPTMSLVSEGTISDVFVPCNQCGKIFENELDAANHEIRVHDYGETFDLYPCGECGFRGTDVNEIRNHIKERHTNESNVECDTLEELGIFKLPEVSKRIKQNFQDLNINEHGDILVDEDDKDEDFEQIEISYQEEENTPKKTGSKRLREKRNFIETSRESKAVEDVSNVSKKLKNTQ